MTWVILTSKTISVHIANLFLDYSMVPFGIPAYLLIDDGHQFVRKCFSSFSGSSVYNAFQPLPTVHRLKTKSRDITEQLSGDFETTSQITKGTGTCLFNHRHTRTLRRYTKALTPLRTASSSVVVHPDLRYLAHHWGATDALANRACNKLQPPAAGSFDIF